jgi:ribonucleoside-diphosphate reductase alpha chain
MNSDTIKDVCLDPRGRIPLNFRKDKKSAATFLMLVSTLNLEKEQIKNPGYWTIYRWLNDEHNHNDYDEVISIEKLGFEKTYDLTVPDGNSFTANGITVHNCNLPNNISVETVKEVYMRGWETGCKGVTIYRDGSRTGVLVSDEPKKEAEEVDGQPEKILENHAPKRPKELSCDIHRVNVKGESYLVLVGMLDGAPYEVFAGLSEHVEVPKKAKTGVLIKNGKKDGVATYNLRIPVGDDDSVLFKDVVELFSNKVYGAFTRTISLALRHGVPVQYLVEQLRKDKSSDITSFSSVIARVLSKGYIPDGTKTTIEKKCLECGGTNLAYQDGCVTCMDCGSSKCG